MASYENLMTENNWVFDEFADEIQTQTASFSGDSSHRDVLSAISESLFSRPTQTPTVSGSSESEIVASRQRRGGVPPTGRVAKRKPKRSATTTFIISDPQNFRQMVQRVTGEKLFGLDEQLPLDTSSYFLDGSSSVLAGERLFDSACSFPTLESWNIM